MKKLLIAVFLGTSLAIGGCGGSLMVHQPSEQVERSPKQLATEALDQASASLAAIARALLNDYKAGAYTKQEKDKYTEEFVKAREYIRKGRLALEVGDIASAETQAKLTQNLIRIVQAELTKLKAKEEGVQ